MKNDLEHLLHLLHGKGWDRPWQYLMDHSTSNMASQAWHHEPEVHLNLTLLSADCFRLQRFKGCMWSLFASNWEVSEDFEFVSKISYVTVFYVGTMLKKCEQTE